MLPEIEVVQPDRRREEAFLAAVRRSRRLHRPFASPPGTPEAFRAYVARQWDERYVGHWIVAADSGELVGVINLNEIVRGGFQSAYLGYYAFAPHGGRGYMEGGLRHIVRIAFSTLGLHRLEANIQPDNARSIELVRKLGFRLEGFSPSYLKIGDRWRDHERWATTRDRSCRAQR
jgi:ribosomal-protein-alanine N-acetyltransferase